jgi:hypothetical protein
VKQRIAGLSLCEADVVPASVTGVLSEWPAGREGGMNLWTPERGGEGRICQCHPGTRLHCRTRADESIGDIQEVGRLSI